MLDDAILFKGRGSINKNNKLNVNNVFQESLRYQQYISHQASNYIKCGNTGIGFAGLSARNKSQTVAREEVMTWKIV